MSLWTTLELYVLLFIMLMKKQVPKLKLDLGLDKPAMKQARQKMPHVTQEVDEVKIRRILIDAGADL